MASAAEPLTRAVSPRALKTETSADDEGLSVFISLRPRLFGIAYRMLGSAAGEYTPCAAGSHAADTQPVLGSPAHEAGPIQKMQLFQWRKEI